MKCAIKMLGLNTYTSILKVQIKDITLRGKTQIVEEYDEHKSFMQLECVFFWLMPSLLAD